MDDASRIEALEAEIERLRIEASDATRLTVENEQRLKSMQHRMDEAEARDEAAARDIHGMQMTLMRQETRIGTTVSLLKVFGSLVTCLSILIQIGRWVFL